MPAPVRTAGGSGNYVSSLTALTIAWPAGTLVGDVGLLFVETCNQAVAFTTNTDNFQLVGTAQGTGTGGADPATLLAVYWCRAPSTTPSSVVITDSGDHQSGTIVVYRGCIEQGNPVHAFAQDVASSVVTAVTWPALTTTRPDCLVVGAVTNSLDATAANVAGYTNANLSAITERQDVGTATGNGGGIAIFEGVATVAGSLGTTTATMTTGSVQGRTILALRPSLKPDFQAAGATATGTVGVTPAWPTHDVGDIALLVCESDAETITLTTANGFVAVDVSPQNTGAAGVAGDNLAVFWCRATSNAMAAPVVADPGDHIAAQILTFRNVKNTGNPWEASAGTTAASSASVTCPAVTTISPNALIVNIVSNLTDTAVTQTSAQANASLLSVTEWADFNTASGNGGGFSVFGGTLNNKGASGSTTATLAGASVQCLMTLALTPQYVAQSGVGVVAGASAQRTDQLAPSTGTLTTVATPAWAASTAYTLDPVNNGQSRVTNDGGKLYQCRTDGTSASSGGPTGTAIDITDGTAHWSFIGMEGTQTTIARSLILFGNERGNDAAASPLAPADNDSGSYTQIDLLAFGSFPTAKFGTWYRTTGCSAKAPFTGNINWGNDSEANVTWIEVRGVTVGAPQAHSQVERASASATSNIVTAAPITTTGPCVIVSWCAGNGGDPGEGNSHIASPRGGLQFVPDASCLMALNVNGYIQQAVAWRIEPDPGTYAESWLTNGEGAIMMTAAFPIGLSVGADPGTFTETGTAATLEVGRRVSAASGTFVETGTAATLRFSHLSAGSGTFTESGTTATLEAGRRVSAASGTFVETGTAANLVYAASSKTLTADSGTFAETGSTAGLEHGYRVSVGSGTFAETGSTAGLEHGYRVSAGSGTFAEAGTPIGPEVGHRMAAGSGTFTETGATAGLRSGYTLPAVAGAYAETGTAATLEDGRRVSAGSGTFTETGTAVQLRAGYTLNVAAGSFVETGAAVSFEIGHRVAAGSGTFAETGSTAGLEAARRVAAGSGAFAETGSTAGLEVGRKVSAGSGAFAETGTAVGLEIAHRLSVGSGAFAETGTAVGLERGYRVTAGPGAFSVVGAPVGFPHERVLGVGAGTISLVGSAAGLEIGRRVAASAGAFALTGSPVSFAVIIGLVADSGAFSVDGKPAILRAPLPVKRHAFGAGAVAATAGKSIGGGSTIAGAHREEFGSSEVGSKPHG